MRHWLVVNMSKTISFLLLFLCISQSKVDSSKILAAFQLPSISHQVVFRHITEELARRGHEVTVITTDAAFPKGQTPPNLTEIELHDISYDIWRNAMVKTVKEKPGVLGKLINVVGALNDIVEAQLRSDEIQTLLNEKKDFDLIMTNAVLGQSLIFSHFYKVPVIQISSLRGSPENDYVMGIPTHPLLYPCVFSEKNYNFTMFEKITEFYNYIMTEWFFRVENIKDQDEMLKNVFGPGIPSVSELHKNVDMLFINTHPLWTSNVPIPPNVIYIWGIHKKSEKELPQDLKAFLDSSKHGVIYMSFGTNTPPSALPAEKIQAFVKVFSELPYDVLWKWDKDELPGKTDNIRIDKWFPQSDLLRHPKVKLFVTHCGLQSTDETISAGVPVVGIPFRIDQHSNMEKYLYYKIGVKVDFDAMTADNFRNAVVTVLGDDSYRKNMIKLREIMRDEPEPALERAVWWTEYVLRHKGAKHLRAAGANLSYAEYYEIKLVSLMLLSLFIATLVALTLIKLVIKAILPSKQKVKQN